MNFEEYQEFELSFRRECRQLIQSGWGMEQLRRLDLRRNGYPRKLSLREVEYLDFKNADVGDLFG